MSPCSDPYSCTFILFILRFPSEGEILYCAFPLLLALSYSPLHLSNAPPTCCLLHCYSSPTSWKRRVKEGLVVERDGFQSQARSNGSGRKAGRLVTREGTAGDGPRDVVHPGRSGMGERWLGRVPSERKDCGEGLRGNDKFHCLSLRHFSYFHTKPLCNVACVLGVSPVSCSVCVALITECGKSKAQLQVLFTA